MSRHRNRQHQGGSQSRRGNQGYPEVDDRYGDQNDMGSYSQASRYDEEDDQFGGSDRGRGGDDSFGQGRRMQSQYDGQHEGGGRFGAQQYGGQQGGRQQSGQNYGGQFESSAGDHGSSQYGGNFGDGGSSQFAGNYGGRRSSQLGEGSQSSDYGSGGGRFQYGQGGGISHSGEGGRFGQGRQGYGSQLGQGYGSNLGQGYGSSQFGQGSQSSQFGPSGGWEYGQGGGMSGQGWQSGQGGQGYGSPQFGQNQGGSYGEGEYGSRSMGSGMRGGMGSSMRGGMQGQSGMGSHAGKGPKGYKRSDERIREEIADNLTRHPNIDASEIEVDVKDGTVTLRGTVDDRHVKYMLEDEIESVLGVRDVENQVRVQRSNGGGSQLGDSSSAMAGSGSAKNQGRQAEKH